jgi:gamma-glutamylcyclotransferase (GGCT)/AIG2-like uncharacterized protein YtfP
MTATFLLAVYGTLRLGQGNHGVLGRHNPEYLGTDTLIGFNMYNTGGFPAVVPDLEEGMGDGPIVVEVFRAPMSALPSCDGLEGYHPDYPKRSMYLRETVDTQYGPAYIYIWNRPLRDMPLIPGGDWLNRR